MTILSLDRHIERMSATAGGKPRIAGRRITVQDIVIWSERMGRSVDEICAEYDLEPAQVQAALAYYFDHREEVDRSMKTGEALVAALRAKTPSVLADKLKAIGGG